MAINLGNYGQEVVQGKLTAQQPDIGIGREVAQLGAQMSQYAAQEIATLQSARVGKMLADQGIAAHKIKLKLYDDQRMGAVKSEEVASEYTKRMDEYRATVLDTQDETIKRIAAPAMEQYSVKSQADVLSAQQEFIRQNVTVNMKGTVDGLLSTGYLYPVGAVEQIKTVVGMLGAKSNLSPEQLQMYSAGAAQNVYVSSEHYKINNSKDAAKLREDAKLWDDTSYLPDVFDPDTRVALQKTMLAKADHLDHAALANQRAAISQQSDEYRQMIQIVGTGTGVPVSPEILTRAEIMARQDHPLAKPLSDSIKAYESASALNGASLAAGQDLIAAQANFAKTAATPDKRDEAFARYDAMVKVHNQNLAAYKQLGAYGYYTAKTGEVVPPINFNTDMQGMVAQFAERKKLAAKVESRTGFATGLLNDDEAKTFGELVKTLPPSRVVDMVAAINAAAPERASATFETIGKNVAPVYAAIGMAVKQQARTTSGADVATLLARGEWAQSQPFFDSIKPTKTQGGTGESIETAKGRVFDDVTGGLFSTDGASDAESRKLAVDLATRAYYALKEKSGSFNNELDEDLFKQAVKVTMGPIYKFNGKQTIANSYYMGEQRFSNNARNALGAMGQALGYNAEELKALKTRGQLIPAGVANGGPVYRVLYNNKLIVDLESRQPVTVCVSEQ